MAKLALIVLVALMALAGVARAETAVPDRLVIGYDNEGKIDASPQACLAHVKEITSWDKAQTEKGARDDKNFVKAFSVDQRLNLASAVSNLATLVKACMEHKFGLTTGGHNIMIDIIENDIAAECLVLGSNLIRDETAKYNALR
jgi:hypothetical protein